MLPLDPESSASRRVQSNCLAIANETMDFLTVAISPPVHDQ